SQHCHHWLLPPQHPKGWTPNRATTVRCPPFRVFFVAGGSVMCPMVAACYLLPCSSLAPRLERKTLAAKHQPFRRHNTSRSLGTAGCRLLDAKLLLAPAQALSDR